MKFLSEIATRALEERRKICKNEDDPIAESNCDVNCIETTMMLNALSALAVDRQSLEEWYATNPRGRESIQAGLRKKKTLDDLLVCVKPAISANDWMKVIKVLERIRMEHKVALQ